MSASHKKQLRKEQNAAQMTEKQRAEQKESRKLRIYTILFAAAIVLMVCFAIGIAVFNSGMIERNSTAATVGTSKISPVELNYYYVDYINEYTNQWGNYISLTGLDPTKPLNEQVYNQETGETWADSFLSLATQKMQHVYATYQAAIAEGYTLSEEDAAEIDNSISTMRLYGMYSYGYPSLDAFLTGLYGHGANEKTYRSYCQVQYIANAYAKDHSDSLAYTDEDIAAVLAENPKNYTSYSYNYYLLSVSNFLEGGTTDENGNTTYSDEERAAAEAACKAAADSIMEQNITTDAALDRAINALDINSDKETAVSSTPISNRMYTDLGATLRDWITDDSRKPGDLGCVANTSESTDDDGNTVTTTNGYYIILFNGSDDNTYHMNNVRHILVGFTGGTKDDDGNTVYSDEEKAAAKAEADEILAQFQAGEQTEDAFAALASEKSDDTGSKQNGGLISNIIPTSNYVENFLNWAIDDARTPGETGIVETEYGYHVMYFVGDSEETYRDYLITNTLRSEDMTEWEDSLVESAALDVKNTKNVPMDLVLKSDSSSNS